MSSPDIGTEFLAKWVGILRLSESKWKNRLHRLPHCVNRYLDCKTYPLPILGPMHHEIDDSKNWSLFVGIEGGEFVQGWWGKEDHIGEAL